MQLVSQLMAGGLVVALLAIALWALRRSGPLAAQFRFRNVSAGRRLEQIERLSLSPHHSLHLVRCDGRALLVGLHSGGVSVIDSRPALETAPRSAPGETRERSTGNR